MTTTTIKRAARSFFTLRPSRKNVSTRVAILGTVAIVLSQTLDFITTTIGISLGAVETNPLMAPIVGSWPVFLLVKAVATTFLCWVAWKRPVPTLIISGLYLIVGYSNLSVLAQLVR
jgi:hypothetical protein